MIKLHTKDGGTKAKTRTIVNVGNKLQTTEGTEVDPDLIPVYFGGRLTVLGVNELGKLLLKAALEGDVEETKSLLNKGALFTVDWLGTSPLHLAAKHNHFEICEMLLRAGISKDARTKVDKTPLHMAAFEGNTEIVEILLEYGADPDCKDLLGMTPLHWAVQNGHALTVQELLKQGAQADITNKFGLKPLEIAMQIDRTDIIALLNMEGNNEPFMATQHLSLQLNENTNEDYQNESLFTDSTICDETSIPLETILSEDNNETIIINKCKTIPNIRQTEDQQNHIEESIRLLQEHGITMLPHEENNILTTVIETGHSVVLTDVGKEMLNSVKEEEKKTEISNKKKFITLTSDEFLQMTSNGNINKGNILKQINGRLVPKSFKRIVMKKNKAIPTVTIGNNIKQYKNTTPGTDMETVMNQLIEARKTIEEMKIKLHKKEQEAERYRQQLNRLLEEG